MKEFIFSLIEYIRDIFTMLIAEITRHNEEEILLEDIE